jgi:hypothetical protein
MNVMMQRPPVCQEGTAHPCGGVRGSVSTEVKVTVVVDDKKWLGTAVAVTRLVQKRMTKILR